MTKVVRQGDAIILPDGREFVMAERFFEFHSIADVEQFLADSVEVQFWEKSGWWCCGRGGTLTKKVGRARRKNAHKYAHVPSSGQ
jgi:hypothetical protein